MVMVVLIKFRTVQVSFNCISHYK